MKLHIEDGLLKQVELEEGETEVVLPEGVTALANGAFDSCTALQSVTIPQSIQEGNPEAFAGCKQLRRATLPFGWKIRDFFDLKRMGVFSFSVSTSGKEGWVGTDGWQTRRHETAYGYTMAFRGPKRGITRLLEAILERAGDEDAGGCLATLGIFKGSYLDHCSDGAKLSACFADLGEEEEAWFVSGGGFLDESMEGLPVAVREHFRWLLTRESELEGCIRAADGGQNECPADQEFWLYTPAGSSEVREGTLEILESFEMEYDEDWEDLGDLCAVSVDPADVETWFPATLGRSYADLCALLDDLDEEDEEEEEEWEDEVDGPVDGLTEESPILDEYRRRLREKRRADGHIGRGE